MSETDSVLFLPFFPEPSAATPLRDQVKEWKEKDPDNIDQMPVEAGVFQRSEMVLADLSLGHHKKHDQEDNQADQHMETVQAGHGVIETEKKDLSLAPSQEEG